MDKNQEQIVKVTYKYNQFMCGHRLVTVPPTIGNFLKGKGDKSHAFIRRKNLKYE